MELNASDPYDIPPSSVFLWSLSGPDAPKFKVSPTSGSLTSLTLRATPDFESAEDNDTDGIYDLNVTVTDVDNTSQTFNLLLTVLDDDEPAYFIYSDDNASPVIQKDAGSFTEHTISTSLSNVTVFDVSAQDHEGSAIIYGFTDHNPSDNSGALGPTNSHYNDNNTTLFEINPSTGRIKFKNPVLIDYEAGLGTVSTSKNTYVLEVNATDDTANPDQARHLLYLTIENVVEGCVREGFAALQALHQAQNAKDPELRAIMGQIACDEARHVELAFHIDAWLRTQLSKEEEGRVDDAKRMSLRALQAYLTSEKPHSCASELGLIETGISLQLFERFQMACA